MNYVIQNNICLVKYCLVIFFFTIISSSTFAKIDTMYVSSDIPPLEGNLNTAINAVADTGSLSNVVFKLEPYGYYILTDSILVPKGEHLKIIAEKPGTTQETAPPQIIWTAKERANSKYIFKVFGDLTLKNIWIMYANTDSWQVTTDISFIRDSLNADKQYGNFEGVIFDYSRYGPKSGGAITVESNKFIGTFKNCYWKNCIDQHFRYYGRAVSFPYYSTGYHIDSLTFENCTFANIGYVLMQERAEFADYVNFNHCTFLNVVMFSLESGWWNKLSVTNSIFVNAYMYGDIPATHWYGPPYSYNEPDGGTIRIDSAASFGFEVPFTDKERHILFANSSYYIEKWLSDWMFYNPYSQYSIKLGHADDIPVPQPMLSPITLLFFDSMENGNKLYPYMNRAVLIDSINPELIHPPTDSAAIKGFIFHKWFDSGDSTWAWKPANSFNRIWPLEENIAYTNQELKATGMGRFPLGDLYHWWPNEYSQWEKQKLYEDSRIEYWLNTGRDSAFTDVKKVTNVIDNFKLDQNYPNPFNPSTKIKYTIASPAKRQANFPKGEALVQLKIYDILGREVATLVNEIKHVGTYEVEFDGTKLSSGVYLYQLKAANFVATKKLILLK